MQNIDPTRLSAIFKSLATRESVIESKSETKQGEPAIHSGPSLAIKKVAARDSDLLKQNLRSKLRKLKAQNTDFETKAPLIAIREILLWEFGEDILNHPDFNHFTQVVTREVSSSAELLAFLKSLISNYSKD